MESSNLLFIVGFLWLLEILPAAYGDWRGMQCPLCKKCLCTTGWEYKFKSVYCKAPEYWTTFKDTMEKYSSYTVQITGDISEIPSNAFSPFYKIDFLELKHTNDQKKQRLNWHKEAFSHVTVDALNIYEMSQAIPPPVALKPLGEKGLKKFGIYRGGKEGVFLNSSTFSLFPELNKLTISETTILGIDPSAFEGLNELTDLWLNSCSLDSFPAASIPSLTRLSLLLNKISSLEEVHFPSDGITDLYLDGNPITSIDSCKWPAALKMLYLSNARLSYIDFSNFVGTQLWFLKANNMPTLKLLKMTSGVLNISFLFLSTTGLMEIDPSVGRVFDHADSVRLDIGNNKNLICDYKMHWIANLKKNPKNSVYIEGSVCAKENKTLEEYLNEIPPPEIPPPEITPPEIPPPDIPPPEIPPPEIPPTEIPPPEIPPPEKPRKRFFGRFWCAGGFCVGRNSVQRVSH